MYPNYPHDNELQSIDTCTRAIEGDMSHVYIASGNVSVTTPAAGVWGTGTWGTGVWGSYSSFSQDITFAKPFTVNTIPDVGLSLSSISNAYATIRQLIVTSRNNTGFTLKVLADMAVTVTVTWLAKGKEE